MNAETEKPGEAATSSGLGSQHPSKDIEMNKATNTTAEPAAASLDIDGMRGAVEQVWADANVMQRKLYLLIGQMDRSLDERRAKIDGTTVTLMFQKRGLDAMQWLTGEVWSNSIDLEKRLHSILGQLDEVAE